jgi:carbonic anhydrase/acetyltransferase-like protein (isoleucine patch superfamily)
MRLSRPGVGDQKGASTVELGSVIVVPAIEGFTAIHEAQPYPVSAVENPRSFYPSRTPILGNDILQSWIERVRKLGVHGLWLTSDARGESAAGSVLAELARQGIERLLVIKLKSYAEMDLADLLRFHCERRNPVTEAQDARGQLGVSLLDRLALPSTAATYEDSSAPTDSGHIPYQFSGYAKRILSARERQELVGDALTAACAMRPLGTQIEEQVWIGEGVNLAPSVRVIGPTYIGSRTTIRDGATIGPFASVESDCVVDCGTTVERSTVLPHTYLAPGILVRHALVDGAHLEDLKWGTVADLQPAGLGSRIRHRERKPTVRETASDSFPRADGSLAWEFAACSTASQPWLQVQL